MHCKTFDCVSDAAGNNRKYLETLMEKRGSHIYCAGLDTTMHFAAQDIASSTDEVESKTIFFY